MNCQGDHTGRSGPLCEHELEFLRLGHVMVRHSERYPLILMWLVT